jgi:hypothetical protein
VASYFWKDTREEDWLEDQGAMNQMVTSQWVSPANPRMRCRRMARVKGHPWKCGKICLEQSRRPQGHGALFHREFSSTSSALCFSLPQTSPGRCPQASYPNPISSLGPLSCEINRGYIVRAIHPSAHPGPNPSFEQRCVESGARQARGQAPATAAAPSPSPARGQEEEGMAPLMVEKAKPNEQEL